MSVGYIGNITVMNEGKVVHQVNELNPFNINIEFNINNRRNANAQEYSSSYAESETKGAASRNSPLEATTGHIPLAPPTHLRQTEMHTTSRQSTCSPWTTPA